MQCNQCGRVIADDAAFCPYCGERLASPLAPRGASVPPIESVVNPTAATNPADPAATHPAVAAERLKQEPTRFGSKDPQEEELWNGAYSPKAMLGQFILVDIITTVAVLGVFLYANHPMSWLALVVGLAILWGAMAIAFLNRRFTVHYRLTRFRLFHEHGIVAREIDRMETIDIDDVTVRQGPVERMLGIGTIVIASTDRTEPQLYMRGIDNVTAVADLIDSTRRAERQRRGLHLEAT